MFCRCESMKSLYLKNWNTKNVTDMSNMFQENKSLLLPTKKFFLSFLDE